MTAWLDPKQQNEEVQWGNEVTRLHHTGFREREEARVKLESHYEAVVKVRECGDLDKDASSTRGKGRLNTWYIQCQL